VSAPHNNRLRWPTRQAIRNLAGWMPAATLVVGVYVGVGVGVAAAEASASADHSSYLERYVNGGGTTLQVSALPSATQPLTGADCSDLAATTGEIGWAWIASAPTATGTGGASVPVSLIGGDVTGVLGLATANADGFDAVADAGSDIGRLRPTLSWITITYPAGFTRQLRLLTVPARNLGPSAPTGLMLLATPPVAVDSCILRTTESDMDTALVETASRFSLSAGYSTHWVLSSSNDVDRPSARWHGRWTRNLWLWGGVLYSAAYAAWMWSRRRETALWCALSPSQWRVRLMQMAESAVVLLVANTVLAIAVAVIARRSAETHADAHAWAAALRYAVMAACLTLAIAATAATGSSDVVYRRLRGSAG